MISNVSYAVCDVLRLMFVQNCSDPIRDASSNRDMIPFMVHRCDTIHHLCISKLQFIPYSLH